MQEPRSVVTVFARNGGRILLEDTDCGWDGLTRPLDGTPAETAQLVLDELLETPEAVSIVKSTGSLVDTDRHLRLHPVLVDVFDTALHDASDRYAWQHPTLLRREPSPGSAWEAYRSVAPTFQEIVEDSERGSTSLSLAALQFLRDESAAGTSWADLVDIATDLVDARAELTALVTRVDRMMARAMHTDESGPAVERIARDELDEAVRADEEAAERAAAYCEDKTVLTISQSGTVQAALSEAAPAEVILLESRPKREAVPVAETLASEGIDVSLSVDAAIGDVLHRRDVDVVLIGADSIDPNGDVRNKVGTRTLATAAQHEGIPVVAVTASDKIAQEPPREAWIDGSDVYDGPATIDTAGRLFDRTPPELITDLVTEVGSLSPDITVWIAAERRRHREWREHSGRVQSV